MADYTSQSQNYPKSSAPSFFDSPRFRAFSSKALFETDSAVSPTSILDPKPFSGDGNRSESPTNSDGTGLALVSKLASGGNVLCGANLKIQIPPFSFPISQSGSPSSGPLFNGFSNSAMKTEVSSPSSSSPRAVELISVSEMKLSEEYTCVISHGSNPKTTHIFDNCIVESFCDFSDQPLSKTFLEKDFEQKNDEFIYRLPSPSPSSSSSMKS